MRALLLGFGLCAGVAAAQGLPPGSVVDPPADSFPAQRLAVEQAGGRQTFLVALGNTAFSSPLLYGAPARAAGLSCNSCHANGHVNRAFFIPGLSTRPAGLDPTNAHFNPITDDGIRNHTDIPSLRGVRFLAPYGRDGRIASLREFARHVIVTEFGGPEPAPLMLDALVAYMNEFEFLPNPRITPEGRLAAGATDAERRGEALFRESRGRAGLACADCHRPETAFADGRAHELAGIGRFRTPTLLNANSSAPYGHDGRWPGYAEAVAAMDDALGPGLSAAARADIVAYLDAVGDAEDAEEPPGFQREMAEVAIYVDVLETAIARGDPALVRFVADTVRAELRRVSRDHPTGDAAHQQARPDRRRRMLDWTQLDREMDAVALAAEARDAPAARAALETYYATAEAMVANYPRATRLVGR